MHRLVRDHIEDVVAGVESASVAEHVKACEECRSDVIVMRAHSAALRELKAPDDAEPRPGFYARVMERIEAQGPASIWNLFIESAFGRRIAMASLALALLLGMYVISSERAADQPIVAGQQSQPEVVLGEDAPGRVITQMSGNQSSNDDVLVNLVTYQEQ
jgi:predicted anti-sigma-YlaC factor YlaD